MTTFIKSGFETKGENLFYGNLWIARFKRNGPVTKSMLKEVLCKRYTVEGYTSRLAESAPLEILRQDGFLVFENGTMKLEGKVIFPKG